MFTLHNCCLSFNTQHQLSIIFSHGIKSKIIKLSKYIKIKTWIEFAIVVFLLQRFLVLTVFNCPGGLQILWRKGYAVISAGKTKTIQIQVEIGILRTNDFFVNDGVVQKNDVRMTWM